jgi:hypothetical protein
MMRLVNGEEIDIVSVGQTDTGDIAGLRASFERLDALSKLEPDWDSYGGLPPTARAIGLVSRVIVESAATAGETPTDVMPLPAGGLQLIWEHEPDELQIDVGPDGTLGYLLIERGRATPQMHEADDISLADARAMVAKLAR